jgi:hypothetical protein
MNSNLQSIGYRLVKTKNIQSFFVPGKVFAMLWVEPAGRQPPGSDIFTAVRFGEQAFAEIRRFIVVKAHSHHSLCVPISTYHGKGVVGRRDARYHSIIYSTEEPPQALEGEHLTKHPIRMIPEGDTLSHLAETSRINYSKTFTVEHNVKVKKIGRLDEGSLAWVRAYWKEAIN